MQWVRGAVPGKGQGSWRSVMNIAMKEETFFCFSSSVKNMRWLWLLQMKLYMVVRKILAV